MKPLRMTMLERHRKSHPAIKLLALAWDLRWRYAGAAVLWLLIWQAYS